MSNVVYLHGQPAKIARFLRVTEHRRLERLLITDKLPYDRFVIEAGSFDTQIDLIKALRQKGRELVLDTNIAESSAIGKFSGHVKKAPWANPSRILTEADLSSSDLIIRRIANFAVSQDFSRVQAPTHFIHGTVDPWFAIDLRNCIALRRALDAEGGKAIAIDYPIMIPNATLNDNAQRREIISQLGSIPFESIWMRISGFGADATPVGLRKYISSVQDFHALGQPVVADGVGGLSGLAIVAFGATSGLSYGVAAKERFDASSWHRPPKTNTGGGGISYSYVLPGIDKLLRREDADAIMASASGRRLASCEDRSCCPLGYEDTIKDPKGHFLRRRAFGCDAISAVQEPVRTRHFLDKDLTTADRQARLLAKLRLFDSNLSARLAENAKRLDHMRDVLGSLEKTSASSTRALGFPVIRKGMESQRDRSS